MCFYVTLNIVHKRKSLTDNIYHLNKGSGYGSLEALLYAKLLIENFKCYFKLCQKKIKLFYLFLIVHQEDLNLQDSLEHVLDQKGNAYMFKERFN